MSGLCPVHEQAERVRDPLDYVTDNWLTSRRPVVSNSVAVEGQM